MTLAARERVVSRAQQRTRADASTEGRTVPASSRFVRRASRRRECWSGWMRRSLRGWTTGVGHSGRAGAGAVGVCSAVQSQDVQRAGSRKPRKMISSKKGATVTPRRRAAMHPWRVWKSVDRAALDRAGQRQSVNHGEHQTYAGRARAARQMHGCSSPSASHVAPFFEEIIFRGFLLPALCTSWTGPPNISPTAPPPARPE